MSATPLRLTLPKREDIAEEHWGDSPAHEFVEGWFFEGAKVDRLHPNAGVDTSTALGEIGRLLRSFQCEHNHKIAGCAQLLSQFFVVSE